MNKVEITELLKMIANNSKIKEEELSGINEFKKLYDTINQYEKQIKTYEEIMQSNNSRLEFLIHAVDIALKSKAIDKNTSELILNMYENIYKYLFENSELEEIRIPNDMKSRLKDNMILPNPFELLFALTLIQENKRIFEKYFNGKELSQTITQGLHTNIKEVLEIKKENVGHLLGLTNDDALQNFYRKTIINRMIKKICNEIGIEEKDIESSEKFKEIFKEIFKLDYSKENKNKLISFGNRKNKDSSDISEEEKIALEETYELIPKEQIVDFYANNQNINELIKENNEVNDFVYEYIKKMIDYIIKQGKKADKNILKETLNDNEVNEILNNNSNQNNVRKLINKYINKTNLNITDNKEFQTEFQKKFGYPFPLIQYNELVSKNISFYNFSLFKNLNKIIVDYHNSGSLVGADIFLVSYAKEKYKKFKETVTEKIKIIKEKYSKVAFKEENIEGLEKEYLNKLKSLLMFPPSTRYYLRFGFSTPIPKDKDDPYSLSELNDSELKQKKERAQIAPEENKELLEAINKELRRRLENKNRVDSEKKIKEDIQKQLEKEEVISLIGFGTTDEEKERISKFIDTGISPFEHHHRCKTNMSANFQDYETDYLKNGIEYDVDMIESSIDDLDTKDGITIDSTQSKPKIEQKRILKIVKPLEILNNYIDLLNDYKNKKDIDYIEKLKCELYLTKEIKKLNELYLKIKENQTRVLNYKLNKLNSNIKNLKQIKKELKIANKEYIKLLKYNKIITEYLKEYEKIILNNNDIIYNDEKDNKKLR